MLSNRRSLNSLPIDDTKIQCIVDEANYAFQLNRDIVHELEPDVKAAIGEHVFDLITHQAIPGATERPARHPSSETITLEYSI